MKAFNIFNALGSIAFAYNFTGVLMEIQVGGDGAAAGAVASGLALRHTASCCSWSGLHGMQTSAAAQSVHLSELFASSTVHVQMVPSTCYWACIQGTHGL